MHSYRLSFGKNHIFQGSIFENIRYGKTNASLEDDILAQKKPLIHEQIFGRLRLMTQMPSCFVGGQQQRIALARFLKIHLLFF